MEIEIIKYDAEIDSLSDLISDANNAFENSKDFFGKSIGLVRYAFLYSKEEMDNYCGKEVPNWCGGFIGPGTVLVYSPSVFNKHGKTNSYYQKVLAHETAHLFDGNIFGRHSSRWVWEGLAGHVAGQNINEKKLLEFSTKEFSRLHGMEFYEEDTSLSYFQSFSFVEYLVKTFGKEKFLDFVSLLSCQDSFDHSIDKFEVTFDIDFDKCEVDWKKSLILKYL